MPSFLRLGSWNVVMFVTYEQLKRAMMAVNHNCTATLWSTGWPRADVVFTYFFTISYLPNSKYQSYVQNVCKLTITKKCINLTTHVLKSDQY